MFAVGSAGDGALCGKKTLQKHMVAQMDMDRRLTASICMLENESKARESRLETKIEQLEAKIEASSELLWARIENKFLKNVDVTDESAQPYRHPNYQVHHSNSESSRSFRPKELEWSQIVGNRECMLKHVELPIFDGEDAYCGIALAEIFFHIGGYDERAKMDVVTFSLVGNVLSWFNSDTHRRGFPSWTEFKEKLIARFIKEKLCDPNRPFLR